MSVGFLFLGSLFFVSYCSRGDDGFTIQWLSSWVQHVGLSLLATVSPVSNQCENGASILTTCFSRFTLVGCHMRIRMRCFVALYRLPLPRLGKISGNIFRALEGVCHGFSRTSTRHVGSVRDIAGRSIGTIRCFLGRRFSGLNNVSSCGRFVRFNLASRSVGGASIPLSMGRTLRRICCPRVRRLVTRLHTCTRR